MDQASSPSIQRNVFRNCYSDSECIRAGSFDDGKVVGNQVLNVNNSVSYGIFVVGERVLVSKNVVENLNNYDGQVTGIYVEGADCDVLKNRVVGVNSGSTDDLYGISVDGAGCNIQKNKVYDCGGGGGITQGILADGSGLVCKKNRVVRLNDGYTYGIYAVGVDATVSGNRVMHTMDGAAINVSGSDYHVSGNTCSDMSSGARGIEATGNSTGFGTASMEENDVTNCATDGIVINGSGVVLRRNHCTLIADDAFFINGSFNTLDRCTAESVHDDGFLINGGGNTFSRCAATDCDKDGYDIFGGGGNRLIRCKATNCGGEGLDNGGSGTIATNCTLRKSRIDYAGAGNMADDTGTVYATGGPGTNQEID